MDEPETLYAHVDQPAFEQTQIDHNISRISIFFVCFITIGVFYFTLVNFPVARMLPIAQIQQFGQLVNTLNPSASKAPVASNKPTGALGGSQISASGSASASAAASPAASASPSASASAATSAAASSSASASPAASGSLYTIVSGDTLSKIAGKYNLSVQALADANKISPSTPLRVGQKLTIPAQ